MVCKWRMLGKIQKYFSKFNEEVILYRELL